MKTRAHVCSALAAAGLLGLAPAALADFNYPNFTSPANMNAVGTAQVQASEVLLTQSARAQAGAIWHTVKQDVSQAWECTMVIRLQDIHGGGADGLALVIQNSSATALGGTGGAMGYGRNLVFNQAGIANSLAVALDTWTNGENEWPEGFTPRVNVQSNGLGENTPDMSANKGSAFIEGFNEAASHTIRVVYAAQVLSVYLDGGESPVLQTGVNLATLLALDQGKAWVGITAATGAAVDAQTHVVQSWSFHTIPTPTAASLLACGTLAGCRRRRR